MGTLLLEICCDVQITNTTSDGALEQHVKGIHGTHTNNQILFGHRFTHRSVRVGEEVNPARVLIPVLIDSELAISSAHHQRVGHLAQDLQVNAYIPDGTIETIESMNAPVIDTQWHSEDPVANIPQLHALLDHLNARRAPRLERTSTTLIM